MSLFEYAQEVVSKKLEREKPMLTISMGMQPVMPMAQGGGLSSVQNSLNINGQPHRLAYINPNEEDLLKSLGGSGEKINGIPAYNEGHGAAEGTSEEGATGEGEDSGTGDGPGAGADAGGGGNPDTYGPQPNVNVDPYSEMNMKNVDPRSRSFVDNISPLGLITAPMATLAKAAVVTAMNNNYGMDPMGVVGNVGHAPSDDDDDDGVDAGGDDIIIKEKIAAVKEVPVEDVSDAEVVRVRQTAEERIAGTNIEDIIKQMYGVAQANRLLNINRQPTEEEEEEEEEEINHRADLIDSIYGPGSSAGLLGITTNNTGTA